ncbi:anosmin-1b isoform X1 [Erpetoichthys calabaricus]|uniref:Anosmin 1b n=1 Tax=Erpetoichthys calabaricus TaxID=27687 RepID=A0A8C4S5E2_ERPCA|nr:anosmin-1b isoform X1 [Erpetoichthys calabaricus]XP_028650399.1 anosmin-1b isoform X1 [Erpetoichthys calabaricus]
MKEAHRDMGKLRKAADTEWREGERMGSWCRSVLTVWLSCGILGASLARRTPVEESGVAEKIGSARCASRCLTLHITQLTAAFKSLQNDDILVWCENNRRCSQCLQPCKELWEIQTTLSQITCEQKHHECLTSSEFLKSVLTQKQGDCRPPEKASGFAAACVISCSADHECPGNKKCCSNGCGFTCQAPANMFKSVPLKLRKDLTFLEDENGFVEVSWMSKFNVSVEPVFYILQRRWNYGIHPSEDESTEWQTVTMTTEDHALLRDIRPNRWYQFRVAAVNTHGTRGFTTPSKHFHSSKDPTPPETPKNVRIGSVTNRSDGALQVKIFWDPPQDDDLSIHHYKVSWSPKILRKTPMATKKERLKLTQGNTSEIQLEGLQPNVDYLILVQAVSYWGQKRLKSAKSQLVLIAGQDSISYNHSVPLLEVSNELPSSQVTSSIRRLEAAAPHYYNNQLQVKVFWKKAHDDNHGDTDSYLLTWAPLFCSKNTTKTKQKANVQGTHFVITGLAFACKYKVTVQPASAAEERNEATVFVTTPMCNSVKLKGARNTACLQDEHTNLAGKITLRAEKLMAIFRNVNGSIVGHFHWKVSQNHPSSLPVTGYQLMWTQLSLSSKASSLPDTIISQTQILPPDQLQFTAQNLLPETFYRIQVQVLSLSGNGPAIAKTFETPQLNSTIL